MEKDKEGNILQNVPAEGREGILKDMCFRAEEQIVRRQFPASKLEELKEKLAETSIKLSQLEAQKKQLVAELENEIKPIKLDVRGTVKQLREKCDESKEVVYLVQDFENGMMDTFDKNGLFISSRRLFADEKQHQVIEMNTGTNG